MIAYVDSSVLVRSYLPDEDGHEEASALLADPEVAAVTAIITRIEVSGALARAAEAGRGKRNQLLRMLDADLGDGGMVTVLGADQTAIEGTALDLVRKYALRALDAWHLAVAYIAVPPLAGPGESIAFASRDTAQAAVASRLGFAAI